MRRRAALLAVTLGPERTLELEREAARDPDPEVRRLVVLATGAAGGDGGAGAGSLASLDDSDLGVRRAAAAQPLPAAGGGAGARPASCPTRSGAGRSAASRRCSRRPLAVRARLDEPLPEPVMVPERARAGGVRAGWPGGAELEPAPAPELHSDEALCLQITQELQGSMRGRTVVDLAGQLGVTGERVVEAAALLAARGQVVRRGTKLFVA